MVSAHMQGGCICENASLLRIGTNNIELAALFAPKPLAAIGANDWTHDVVTRGLPGAEVDLRLYGAADRVDAKNFAFEHNYNQVSREFMYGWFNRALRLGTARTRSRDAVCGLSPRPSWPSSTPRTLVRLMRRSLQPCGST